jgi:hypothetical protein
MNVYHHALIAKYGFTNKIMSNTPIYVRTCMGCSFKFPVKVGVEESIVNALQITDHGSAI